MTPKLPKKISLHISTSYSNRSFSRTYSLGAVVGILLAVGVFVLGIAGALVYSLNVFIDQAEVGELRSSSARLAKAVDSLSVVEKLLDETEKKLDKIQIMLGIEKSPDTVDFTELVFAYKPIIPQVVSDSLESDSLTDSTLVEEDMGFYPQVFPTVGFRVTKKFSKYHPGIDFAASEGKPVFATADGIVSEVGYDSLYGNYLKIKHGKYYETFYGHLQLATVSKGEKVEMNQIVGFVGNTGQSSAPHLHFEVRHKGTPIDPGNLFVFKREYKGGAYD